MNVKRRAVAGFAVLLTLFTALVVLQLVVGGRMRTEHTARAARLAATRAANGDALQYMTDAETGIRGFQLTGRDLFLEPYTSGRVAAMAALDTVAADSRDPQVQALVAAERDAAVSWLYEYAIPVVGAGVADTDEARIAYGKVLFDRLRTTNADVGAAVDAGQRAEARDAQRDGRRSELWFAWLSLGVLVTGLALASLHQRHMLEPVEHIRLTLRRLADGDRSARAVPAGPEEMRVVISSLNDLAADTERLLAEEKARTVRGELRQAVAAELRAEQDPQECAVRTAELIGAAFGATAVHSRSSVRRGEVLTVDLSAGSPLELATIREVRAAVPGVVFAPQSRPGSIAVALSGDRDCPPGVICVVRDGADFTEEEHRLLAVLAREIDHAIGQKRLHLSQSRLITELRTLDEQKDVFVSTVTHELRTPLTSILGYTEMLADGDGGDLSVMQRRGIAAILQNANRLQATIGDLILLGRSDEQGGLRAGGAAAPVDLAGLATAVHGDLAPAVKAKALTSSVEAPEAWVRGDAGQLERALRNLLENAIKFTPAGGDVQCRVHADGDDVVVTVSDTGIGIPADDVPGLFTPFHRAANAMHLAVQGSGLGLAIVRTIVTEHGGTVAAGSELDRGSTFTMTLPAAAAPGE